jgi:PAS domain S-box-containing protein
MIIPEDRARAQELILARITNGERILPFDTIRLHKDGTPVAVSVSVSPVRDGEGRIIGASKTSQDITDRKRAQKRRDTQYEVTRILAKRQSLEDAAPSILGAVCRGLAWDVGQFWTADASGRMLRRVGQWRADEIEPGSSVLDAYTTYPLGVGLPGCVWEGGKPQWIWELEKLPADKFPRMYMARNEGLRAAFAFPITTSDKTTGVMEFFTREDRQPDPDLINAVTALGRQIGQSIDQSRTEQALAKSEARFRKLVEGSSDGIVVVVDGVIREASERFAEIFSMTVEEVIGRRAADFSSDDARGTADLRIDGDVEGTYEIAGKRKDGSKVLLEISARTHNFGGHRERVASARDVTEKRQLEIQLRQAQKMEAVGRLAGGIAHDFNNLLTVIITYVGLLLEGVGETDPRREDIDEIGKAAKAAADLTRQLLAFSRQQVLEPKVLVIEEIVASSQKLLTRLLGEDIQLVTTLAGGTTVKIDSGQLEQIIVNLAVNARDAMPTGGKITIETAVVDLSDAYAKTHWPAVPGRFAMLTVSDTGTGMDAETQSRIFEPFFTTKELGSGTGLGLATVYGIVKQSGGFIWVYSEPGDGATFKIYLPLVGDSPSKADRPALPEIPRGNETILLLEDSPEVRVAVRESLKRYGYNVMEAASGNVAIDIATKHGGPIDLLLTDVVMPEMSGRVAAEQLTGIRPDMKVLFMSGYTADAVVRHGVLSHGVAYLQKPFSPDALARRIREVLDIVD